ncbi:hypothetical protein JCM21900_004299 [Sporobolomyces salmonicolor]
MHSQFSISNQTCILTPTATEGPYYLNSELLRTSLAEDEPGVPLSTLTIIARSGTVSNEGQIFFDEALIAQVLNTSAYLNTTESRTYNDEDSILASALDSSWNPFVDYELVGDSILDGIFGSITLGVDTNASITIDSTNTLSSLAPTAVASALSAAGLSAYISTATAVVTAAATNVVTSAGSRLKLFV